MLSTILPMRASGWEELKGSMVALADYMCYCCLEKIIVGPGRADGSGLIMSIMLPSLRCTDETKLRRNMLMNRMR